VNITCIQDSPECIFHITAYNSQVDKILDVRLVQPGECTFVGRQCQGSTNWSSAPPTFRYTHWPGIGMLCLLEGSHDQRHLGPQLHIAHRCQTVPRVLCKYSLTVWQSKHFRIAMTTTMPMKNKKKYIYNLKNKNSLRKTKKKIEINSKPTSTDTDTEIKPQPPHK